MPPHTGEPLRINWARQALTAPTDVEIAAAYTRDYRPTLERDLARAHDMYRFARSCNIGPYLSAAFGYRLSRMRALLSQYAMPEPTSLEPELDSVVAACREALPARRDDEMVYYTNLEPVIRRIKRSGLSPVHPDYTAARRAGIARDTSTALLDFGEALEKSDLAVRLASGQTTIEAFIDQRAGADCHAIGRRLMVLTAEKHKRTLAKAADADGALDRQDYEAVVTVYNALRARP